ncbi:MAG TPA: class I SAM-dependent methyltransferase [Steroidobacteraceae bacterium]|nr:class I SAM-dependent methyltransferase [Steroidobacteraceae bacterium]
MFKDHFSKQAELYRRYRPGYPPELFEWLASVAPARGVALDCATGNGQAALGLAQWFDHVIAIDGSWPQLSRATRHARIGYAVDVAECLAIRSGSVDLVAAAQAAHWFDAARFHREVNRVLAPGGVIAVWTYEKFRVDALVDAIVDRFYTEVIGPYWPPERRHVEQGYRELPFPYADIDTPSFEMCNRWSLETVIGYLGSWSAVQRYRDQCGRDPLPELAEELASHWPHAEAARKLRWPIHLRAGRR